MLINYSLYVECVSRFSVREEASGRLQLNHKNYLEYCNVIIAILTGMLKSKMRLMCKSIPG